MPDVEIKRPKLFYRKERLHDKNEVAYCINNYSTHNTDSCKTKTLQVAVVIILLVAFITGHVEIVK